MTTTFLFWNLNRKPLQSIIANLIFQHSVDVLMLAECSIPPDILLKTLNQPGEAEYYYAPSLCEKVQIFTHFTDEFIRPVFEADRLTIRHLTLPGQTDILLAVIHLISKRNYSDESQIFEAFKLSGSIRDSEREIGHMRTVLVGDLNMNPFEDGMISAGGLHALMSQNVVARETRIVQGEAYPFFYNPMWSLLGDASSGPPGTYYYQSADHKALFWNMFDQVLVRPVLLDRFSNEGVEIVQSSRNDSLLSPSGLPNQELYSDHLPIVFKLNL